MAFLLVTIWWFSYCFDILSRYILCLILLGICVWRGRPTALRCYISWCCKGFWGSPGELCLFAVHFFIMIIMFCHFDVLSNVSSFLGLLHKSYCIPWYSGVLDEEISNYPNLLNWFSGLEWGAKRRLLCAD